MIRPNDVVAAMTAYASAPAPAPAPAIYSPPAAVPAIPPALLAQNESALPPSPRALAAARAALRTSRLYPDADWTALRTAIAAAHDLATMGLGPANILCGNGSLELIAAVLRAYGGPGARVLSGRHAYPFFRTASEACGAVFDGAPEVDFTLDVDALLAHVRRDTRIVCVANPGNPTGTRISHDAILRLRHGLRGDILLLIDEAYGEFTAPDDRANFNLVRRGDTVLLRTFSKAYGLAGLRVGWGLFPLPVAQEVRKLLMPNNVSAISQAAAAAAMGDPAYMQKTCASIRRRRRGITRHLRRLGFPVPDSHTNFVLIPFSGAGAAQRAERHLRDEGVMLRHVTGMGLDHCLRAGIGSTVDMRRLADGLAAWRMAEGEA